MSLSVEMTEEAQPTSNRYCEEGTTEAICKLVWPIFMRLLRPHKDVLLLFIFCLFIFKQTQKAPSLVIEPVEMKGRWL